MSILRRFFFCFHLTFLCRKYDSGPGCSSFLCWKTSKSHSGKVCDHINSSFLFLMLNGMLIWSSIWQVKPENHIHGRRKRAHILLLGQCGRSKSVTSRSEAWHFMFWSYNYFLNFYLTSLLSDFLMYYNFLRAWMAVKSGYISGFSGLSHCEVWMSRLP